MHMRIRESWLLVNIAANLAQLLLESKKKQEYINIYFTYIVRDFFLSIPFKLLKVSIIKTTFGSKYLC